MSNKVMKFRNTMTPKQAGELARLRVLAGVDSGSVYVLASNHVRIGRENDNDIVLSDLKASRHHAEIVIQTGVATLRDLGSSHGVAVNAVQLRESQLKTGDKVGIGESVFEYIANEAGSTRMINTQPAPSSYTKFIPRPNPSQPSPVMQASGKQSFIEKNKKVIFMLAGLMLVAVFLPTVENAKKKKKAGYVDPNEVVAERALSSIQPPATDLASTKAAENFFKEGYREFRAKNYNRAKMSFETALQIYPMHQMSLVYLETTKKAMEDEAKSVLADAKKDEEAFRNEEAKSKYENVKRMYMREPASDQYKEAQKRIEELDKRLKDGK